MSTSGFIGLLKIYRSWQPTYFTQFAGENLSCGWKQTCTFIVQWYRHPSPKDGRLQICTWAGMNLVFSHALYYKAICIKSFENYPLPQTARRKSPNPFTFHSCLGQGVITCAYFSSNFNMISPYENINSLWFLSKLNNTIRFEVYNWLYHCDCYMIWCKR